MNTVNHRTIEHIFFFTLLAGAAFLVWQLFAPFAGALTLAIIIVTICYPLYLRVLKVVPKQNPSFAALSTVLLVVLIVVLPLAFLGSLILREALSVYELVNSSAQFSYTEILTKTESIVRQFIPNFSLDVTGYVEQIAQFIATHLVSIFAGTASTVFMFFVALIASFFFFRDGRTFTSYLVKLSPLGDGQDELILSRLARSVRGVATGTLLVSLIQGILTGIGLALVGFDRAILWGCVAALGALIPGIGTAIVFVPAVVYLIFTGSFWLALAVAVWGMLAVGFIDNLLGPYFMSRGNQLHPFLILLSVLGGIVVFGPIGFILGPVIMSLFTVLLELYSTHMRKSSIK